MTNAQTTQRVKGGILPSIVGTSCARTWSWMLHRTFHEQAYLGLWEENEKYLGLPCCRFVDLTSWMSGAKPALWISSSPAIYQPSIPPPQWRPPASFPTGTRRLGKTMTWSSVFGSGSPLYVLKPPLGTASGFVNTVAICPRLDPSNG